MARLVECAVLHCYSTVLCTEQSGSGSGHSVSRHAGGAARLCGRVCATADGQMRGGGSRDPPAGVRCGLFPCGLRRSCGASLHSPVLPCSSALFSVAQFCFVELSQWCNVFCGACAPRISGYVFLALRALCAGRPGAAERERRGSALLQGRALPQGTAPGHFHGERAARHRRSGALPLPGHSVPLRSACLCVSQLCGPVCAPHWSGHPDSARVSCAHCARCAGCCGTALGGSGRASALCAGA